MILIPAIDLKQGLCVRLRQGRMEDSTVFSDDPVAMAGQWVEQGAGRLHVVDLADPLHPEIVGFVGTPSVAFGIDVAGDHAFLACSSPRFVLPSSHLTSAMLFSACFGARANSVQA